MKTRDGISQEHGCAAHKSRTRSDKTRKRDGISPHHRYIDYANAYVPGKRGSETSDNPDVGKGRGPLSLTHKTSSHCSDRLELIPDRETALHADNGPCVYS